MNRPLRSRLHMPGSMHLRILIVTSLLLLTSLLSARVPAARAASDIGFRDFAYVDRHSAGPTAEKPESKLWWNDGVWWGSLYSPTAGAFRIHRLALDTQQWLDTGTSIDPRKTSLADTLWDETAQKLYIVSHEWTTNAQPTTNAAFWGRLYRYSYTAAMQQYTLDSGFPVNVTRGRSETLTVAKDSTGQLWVTYVQSGKVMVNRSLGSDLEWGTPFVLPVSAASVSVDTDDISSVVGFQGDKIGVLWSNQVTSKLYFAVHLDSDADTVWQAEQTALPGPGCSGPCADDHINLKSLQADSSGRVFAAIKTSHTQSNAPLVMLLVRDLAGTWESHVFGRQRDGHTRPLVLLDEEHGTIYMFATAPEQGGTIYYKVSPIDNIAFEPGRGDVFIQSSTDININNATSTKQNLNSTTGLVVLAADNTTKYYFHNYLSLAEPPSPPPGSTGIKDITFEDGSLTHPTSGVDKLVGTVTLETTTPLKGAYSARIPNVATAYLDESFTATDDLSASFYLRIPGPPASTQRIAGILNAGTYVGNIRLTSTGKLRLFDGSTQVGADSARLNPGALYRVGLRQKRGSGGDGILEGYLAEGDAPFGAPFAATTSGTWTTPADRFRFGATTAFVLDATFDDVRLDTGSMAP